MTYHFYNWCVLDPFTNKKSERIERYRNHRVAMLNKTRSVLDNFFRPYNQRLAEMLGDDKWLWKPL